MAETGITMEIESQNEGAFNHNEAEAPSLDNTSNPIHEKETQDTAEHPSVNESGDFLAPLQNSSDTPRTDIGVSDSDQGATDSEAGITDSEPIVTDSEAGATDSEGGLIDSETSGTDPARHHGDQLLAPSVEEHKPEETTGDSDSQAKPTDLPIKETPAEGEDNSKKATGLKTRHVHFSNDTVNKEDSTHPAGEKTPGKENPKHRRPVIDASKLKDKSDRQKKYRNKQLELQKKSIDQQKQTKEQKRQAVEERRKKQDEEKKVYRESIVRRSIERSQSAGSREKRRSWDPAKQIPASEPPRGRSMERLNDTPNEMVPAGIGVNKRLSSSVSTLWNPVQLVRLGPNQDDWFEVHTPRPKALRSPSPGIDDPNSSTYTPRHHSSSPNLAFFESAEYLENEFCEEDQTGSNPQKHRYAASTASSRSRISTTSQNKSSPSTPIRRTPTPGSRGRSTERKTTAPVQPASTSETPAKTQRPASPKGFRAPSPKPSPGTPTSSSNSSMHVRQPSLRLKNKTTVDAKSPTDKTSKTPVSKSSQPPPIKKALTPAKSSPTRTPRTPSTNNKTVAASKTPAASRTPAASKTPTTTTTRTSAGSRTPTSTKTPTSKPPAANKTPTAKPAAAKSPTVPKATPITKATPTPKETPKAPSPTKEEAPKPDVPQVTEPEKKSSDSETSSPPPELSAEERAKQALAEKRRQMREKAEREAELQRLQKEQEEKEEEERLRREEEERIREEEEEQRLAEEYRKAEEERLQKAIEEQQRKEEEERLRAEEEEKKREEEERIKAEEKKKREEELNEKLKKEEEARDARKKRVDEIMKRARRSTPAVKNDDERDNRDEDKDIDTKAEKENGIEGSIYNNDNDKYRNCFGNGSTVASHETLSGEMEQDMEAVQEGVMGEDDTAYGMLCEGETCQEEQLPTSPGQLHEFLPTKVQPPS
ncbi:proteoglycan 4-like isoform X3 [Anneissia japonica]|uniref:proteoglycan 4-like isoform X3 n=1 Tax=Anneissia japonica TaxID=1529436 RepID=UPI0014255EAA|nr:proteoglycan 4-like isoform X3 [Anneissia japonica]